MFPAPPQVPAWAKDRPAPSPNVIWDEQPRNLPGGGAHRPLLWLPADAADIQHTLIYFHGNGEDLGSSEGFLKRLQSSLGVNILAVEYPGYGLLWDPDGLSDLNVADVQGINSAALHALYYVVLTRGIDPTSVTLYGRSLGSGPALWLANYARTCLSWDIGGVVLQSPFISMTKVAADHAGAVGARFIPSYYDNKTAVTEFCRDIPGSRRWTPLLILHGELDEFVAPYHGRELHSEALRLGHPSADAKYPATATHDIWNLEVDLSPHVARFMAKHARLNGNIDLDAAACGKGRSDSCADLMQAAWESCPWEACDIVESKPILNCYVHGEFNKGFCDILDNAMDLSYTIANEHQHNLEPVSPL